MKTKTNIFILFIFFSLPLFSQEDYNVEEVDNSDFPIIKVYIRANEEINLKQLFFHESNKKLKYVCDTIEGESYGNGSLSVLFVIKQDDSKDFINPLFKTINKLSSNDKINIAVLLKQDTIKNIFHYISPDFSNNHTFFINALQQSVVNNIKYEINTQNEKLSIINEKNILKTQDIYSSKAIIFIMDKLKNKPETYSNILKQLKTPIYILLTQQPDSLTEKELSKISTKTGGIYTVTETLKLQKQLFSYIEDVKSNKDIKKTEMLRIIFETTQHKKDNLFTITYQNKTKQYSFKRPQEYLLSFREQILLLLSGMLLIVLFVVLYKNKKTIKHLELKKIKGIKTVTAVPVKNIEINVKAKGFNKTYFFEKHIIRIGRSTENDIVIPDRTVSAFHAIINREGNNFVIQDLGSTNGILINQKKIQKQTLKISDKIIIGAAIIIVRV